MRRTTGAGAGALLAFARANRALPRDAIALAINPGRGRSQNQLHSCRLRAAGCVRDYLTAHVAEVPPRWSDWTVHFDGHRFWAMRLAAADLNRINLFDLLANGIPGARDHMGDWTLVAVGVEPTGFIVLAGHVDPATGDRGAGEALQDHGRALAYAAAVAATAQVVPRPTGRRRNSGNSRMTATGGRGWRR